MLTKHYGCGLLSGREPHPSPLSMPVSWVGMDGHVVRVKVSTQPGATEVASPLGEGPAQRKAELRHPCEMESGLVPITSRSTQP